MSLQVLHVLPGLVPPNKDPSYCEDYYLPSNVCGDVLLPTWAKTPQELIDEIGRYPTYQANNFVYHLFAAGRHAYGGLRQKLDILAFYLITGIRLGLKKRYDVVKCYGCGLTGLTGLALAKLLGAKLIIELVSAPEDMYRFHPFGNTYQYAAKVNLRTRLARVFAQTVLRVVVSAADHVQLLYPWQLHAYPSLQKVPSSVIAPFVAVHKVPAGVAGDGSVLMVGAPWYLKGVDVLIQAWRKVEHEFPHNKLAILGYYPEQEKLREMIGDSRQIEILKARPNPETLEVMSHCSVFVLASRTEGAPRVFIEAMAAGKPIIGSRVGGVAHYIHQAVNGLVFKSENVDELVDELRLLLQSRTLRERLGTAGRKIAMSELDEASFGYRVGEMLINTIYGQAPHTVEQEEPDHAFAA